MKCPLHSVLKCLSQKHYSYCYSSGTHPQKFIVKFFSIILSVFVFRTHIILKNKSITLFGSIFYRSISLILISIIIPKLQQRLKMKHLISIYYKECHYHRIYYVIFAPLEQKEKREKEASSKALDILQPFQLIWQKMQGVVFLYSKINKLFLFQTQHI